MNGPVLSIGCGPGRMVGAEIARELCALGIDVTPTAVRIAAASGLTVLAPSVFDRVPPEGSWATALLMGQNIGIVEDPGAMLTPAVPSYSRPTA